MTSYFLRYLHGEREAVWTELRALGPVPDALAEDVAAVADETMVRVSQHVARIAAALPELDWVSSDRLVSPHQPPTEGDHALIDELVDKIGGLPYALEACLRRVGEVWFAGDCDALYLTYHQEPAPTTTAPGAEYPDPLCLGNAYSLHLEWEERDDPTEFAFALAPDEYVKTNVEGGTHDIDLPAQVADPVLRGVAGRPGITLVDYLRESVRWGGFPGYSFAPDLAPEVLITLRTDPDF
ncbi:hypothetical protein [Actinokineospora iranica]|uniref:Uncharacterized protein n=1 Tax=Actinokineospora iranica TaxID=1271860 RepID=A0A1G6N5N3_9PSEU|nr:hypothetical protein [Actinokineospora iranica]SDC62754.1 hypothetical protein SAMN05216174_103192 [Actinokineospora iranica]